jgi:hypothetical protein
VAEFWQHELLDERCLCIRNKPITFPEAENATLGAIVFMRAPEVGHDLAGENSGAGLTVK